MKKFFIVMLPLCLLLPSCQKVIDSPGFKGVAVDSLSGVPVSDAQILDFEFNDGKKDSLVLLSESDENGRIYIEPEIKWKLFPQMNKVLSARTMVLRHKDFKEKLVTGFVSDIRLTGAVTRVDTVFLQRLPGH